MSEHESDQDQSHDSAGWWGPRQRPKRKPINQNGAKRVVRSLGDLLATQLGRTQKIQSSALQHVSGHVREFIAGATDDQSDRLRTTVRGYGIGPHSPHDQTLVVRIYVTEKKPLSKLPPMQRVPPEFGKLRTDVVPVGEVKPLSGSGGSIFPFAGSGGSTFPFAGSPGIVYPFQAVGTDVVRELYKRRCEPMRPVVGGISIAPSGKPWSGTLGAIVKRTSESSTDLLGLTNNHVAANLYQQRASDIGSEDEVQIGHEIDQPASMDDLTKNPRGGPIGKLLEAAPLLMNEQDFSQKQVDAALVELDAKAKQEVYDGWTPAGTTSASLFQTVIKCGRTTGLTLGLVYDLYTSIWVDFGFDTSGNPLNGWFNDQITVIGHAMNPHFSAGGDSGSLVFDYQSGRAVGLLFAGSDTGLTFMNPIDEVIKAFSQGGTLSI